MATGGSRGRCSSRRSFGGSARPTATSRPSPSGSTSTGTRCARRRRLARASWGAGGYGEVWVGREAAWTWRHVHHATRYASWLVQRHRAVDGRRGQALDQSIRELLLLQSSDWPFILRTRYRHALRRGAHPRSRASPAAPRSPRGDRRHRRTGLDLARRPVPARQLPRRPDRRRPPPPLRLAKRFGRDASIRSHASHRRDLHGARHPVPGRARPTDRLGRVRRARRRADRRRCHGHRPVRDDRREPDALARRARPGGRADRAAGHAKRVQVIAGAGSNSTREAVRSRRAGRARRRRRRDGRRAVLQQADAGRSLPALRRRSRRACAFRSSSTTFRGAACVDLAPGDARAHLRRGAERRRHEGGDRQRAPRAASRCARWAIAWSCSPATTR